MKTLNAAGYRPRVILHREGPFLDLVAQAGIEWQCLQLDKHYAYQKDGALPANVVRLWRAARPIRDYLTRHTFDLVHLQDIQTLYHWALPARRANLPILHHWRSNYRSCSLLPVLLPLVNQIACVSQFAARGLPCRLASRVEVIINPFENEKPPPHRDVMRNRLLQELDCPNDAFLVGLFANFARRKRQELFVEIMALVRKLEPSRPVYGLLFGRPEESVGMRVRSRITNLGLEDWVYIMGFRMPGEEYIAGCDLAVAPAVEEPYGRSIVESMLVGTPVVASYSGGNPEIIEHKTTGILVEADNPEAFARWIVKLIDQPNLRSRLCDAAYETARQRHSMEAHFVKVVSVYARMLALE
jgi:glycosyltransferase involved in cell wall biosynthesis